MIKCQQKYCKYCIKPHISILRNEFVFGFCKISNKLILGSDMNPALDVQPLYCYAYKPRKRKINY